MSWEVREADCLDAMKEMTEASVDSIVTDPPYGLSAEPNTAEVLRHWLAGDDYQHRGGGFMGKTWDSFVPGPKVWAECHRVLKPGGHLLAFFGTRTYDLGAIAIRLGGFEIRDCLAWMYGSGFPKSLDVSKAIDKAAGAEREVVGSRRVTPSDLGQSSSWNALDTSSGNYDYTAPATPAAQKWQGWGTALKPAFEPIILARKPLTGTVAANVQEFGTGALNIDGGRVGFVSEADRQESTAKNQHADFGTPPLTGNTTYGDYSMVEPKNYNPPGRWPANVILDPEAGAMLDEQSGERPGGNYPEQRGAGVATGFGLGLPTEGGARQMGDTGGASRFFYCPKSSRAERNAGLDGFEERPASDRYKTISTLNAANRQRLPAANVHPTVKPIDLMRYLVRLVTPPGGVVLDPFTGSGTTGIAAGLEGFDFIGIEREAEYREIAEARLKWWADQEGETAEILQRAGLAEKREREAKESGQVSLFDEEAA